MRHFSLLLASLIAGAFSVTASADIIKCVFTEPFVSSSYSMTKSTLTYETPDSAPQIIKNVSFQIKGPAHFQLVSKTGVVLQDLNLNFQGSDGMSDTIFPYEVIDSGFMSGSSANRGYGGCYSNHLKTVQ